MRRGRRDRMRKGQREGGTERGREGKREVKMTTRFINVGRIRESVKGRERKALDVGRQGDDRR